MVTGRLLRHEEGLPVVDQDSAPRRAWRWDVLLNVEDLCSSKRLLRKPSPAGKRTRAMASPAGMTSSTATGCSVYREAFHAANIWIGTANAIGWRVRFTSCCEYMDWHGQCHWLARTLHFNQCHHGKKILLQSLYYKKRQPLNLQNWHSIYFLNKIVLCYQFPTKSDCILPLNVDQTLLPKIQ